MDYNIKKYKNIKIKNYFKNNNLFFIFNSNKIKNKNWIFIEQDLKKLKLKYYKVFNKTTLKTLNNSIFKNFKYLVCGIILLIKLKSKKGNFNLKIFEKHLKINFLLLLIKLNNKFYSVNQFNQLKIFSYKKNIFFFL